MDKYDTVVAILEFSRELQKQFQSMSDEVCNFVCYVLICLYVSTKVSGERDG